MQKKSKLVNLKVLRFIVQDWTNQKKNRIYSLKKKVLRKSKNILPAHISYTELPAYLVTVYLVTANLVNRQSRHFLNPHPFLHLQFWFRLSRHPAISSLKLRSEHWRNKWVKLWSNFYMQHQNRIHKWITEKNFVLTLIDMYTVQKKSSPLQFLLLIYADVHGFKTYCLCLQTNHFIILGSEYCLPMC